jgi:hypothetical protein
VVTDGTLKDNRRVAPGEGALDVFRTSVIGTWPEAGHPGGWESSGVSTVSLLGLPQTTSVRQQAPCTITRWKTGRASHLVVGI